MDVQTIIQLISAVSTAIIAIGGIYVAYYYGYRPKKKQEQIDRLQKELLECYQNINSLLVIESDYLTEESIGKQTTRKGLYTTKIIEPKNVQRRIEELSQTLMSD